MNFLTRLFQKSLPHGNQENAFRQVNVLYEATISFASHFLVHFYDSENKPVLLEKNGTYFRIQQQLPLHRHSAYFRVHVYNPHCLAGQTITISIKTRQSLLIEKTFLIPTHNSYIQWHSLKANLI